MRKEIAAASVIAAFLSSATPLQASLEPPDYKETSLSPAQKACLQPYRDVHYGDTVYRSDGVTVRLLESPLGQVFFVKNFFEGRVYPCQATMR
ncbi:MAG TPA: hypothetical protein VFS88_06890 [Micavibrio sp.]|nr:hypothetical protein [Micavibrio sp.]